MQKKTIRTFLLFTIGQTISQFGSNMTSFAVVIWAYTQKGNTMVSTLLAICSMVPCLLVNLFGGAVADRADKKKMILICDSLSALGSLIVLGCFYTNHLEIWILCAVNVLNGFMNAFQSPASQVTVSLLVSQEDYVRIGAIQSVCNSLTGVLQPILAAMFLGIGGLGLVLKIDLATFIFAFMTLLVFIRIPDIVRPEDKTTVKKIFIEMREGISFLQSKKSIFSLLLFYSILEFIGAVDSLHSPLILARSGNNEMMVSIVSAISAAGCMLSSMILVIRHRKRTVFPMFAGSFLCFLGIFTLGIGRTMFVWCVGAAILGIGCPLYTTYQMTILREQIPIEMQGRIFALKGMITQLLMPVGFLLGSFLSDYVFKALIASENALSDVMILIMGKGNGIEIGMVFLLSGIIGMFLNCAIIKNPKIQSLET